MSELLADHTTLRLGGPARHWVEATTEAELIEAVTQADANKTPTLIVSGGSNLVVADEGFDGTVIHVATSGVVADVDCPDDIACLGAVTLTAAAGEHWDALVERAVDSGWAGIESLSGIPGAVGSTPIQNVGAYGQEVSQTIARVRTWDRVDRTQRTFSADECGFSYRHSRFKADPSRYVVLEVSFLLKQGSLGMPVTYAELARTLDVPLDQGPQSRAPMTDVRQAVLALRRSKGMVLDPADHDTWSAGSFFTNPILSGTAADKLPEDAPRWPQPDGSVKTSAAWLIDHAGFGKGFALPDSGVSLSTKHALALTNRGAGTTAELLDLARHIRAGVENAYDVTLVNEPVVVGTTL